MKLQSFLTKVSHIRTRCTDQLPEWVDSLASCFTSLASLIKALHTLRQNIKLHGPAHTSLQRLLLQSILLREYQQMERSVCTIINAVTSFSTDVYKEIYSSSRDVDNAMASVFTADTMQHLSVGIERSVFSCREVLVRVVAAAEMCSSLLNVPRSARSDVIGSSSDVIVTSSGRIRLGRRGRRRRRKWKRCCLGKRWGKGVNYSCLTSCPEYFSLGSKRGVSKRTSFLVKRPRNTEPLHIPIISRLCPTINYFLLSMSWSTRDPLVV